MASKIIHDRSSQKNFFRVEGSNVGTVVTLRVRKFIGIAITNKGWWYIDEEDRGALAEVTSLPDKEQLPKLKTLVKVAWVSDVGSRTVQTEVKKALYCFHRRKARQIDLAGQSLDAAKKQEDAYQMMQQDDIDKLEMLGTVRIYTQPVSWAPTLNAP